MNSTVLEQPAGEVTIAIPQVRKIEDGLYKVRSLSHPSLWHSVRVEGESLRCSCPARRYPNCRHRKAVRFALEVESIWMKKNTPTQPEPTPEPPAPAAPARSKSRIQNFNDLVEEGVATFDGLIPLSEREKVAA